MEEFLRPDRNIVFLIARMDMMTRLLCCGCGVFMVVHAATFLRAYSQVRHRLENESWRTSTAHLLYVASCLLFVSPFFAMVMVAAVWKAALSVVVSRTFEYEVALKPSSASLQKLRPALGALPLMKHSA